MNSKWLVSVSALLLTFTGFTAPTWAHDDGDIPSRIIALHATTNAPAGATGFAVVNPGMLEGPTLGNVFATNVPSLFVGVGGLSPGTYTVTITDTATNSYELGKFDVAALSNTLDSTASPFPPTTAGHGEFPLPDGVGPFAVADVSVSDADGLVDLTGSFTAPPPPPPPSTNHLFETAVLVRTTNAPAGAAGFAVLSNGIFPEADSESTFWHATNGPTVHVLVAGLLTGTYTVTITDTATNDTILGTIDVTSITNIHLSAEWSGFSPGNFTAGKAQFDLPDGLDPLTIVGISVADADDAVDLTGKFKSPVLPPPHHEIKQVTILGATTNAPPDAMGRAKLEVKDEDEDFDEDHDGDDNEDEDDNEDDDGNANSATVQVETIGLLVGTYTVKITDTATNDYTLGTFDVNVRTNCLSGVHWGGTVVLWSNTFGRAELPLPDGLDPASVVSIDVSDADGLVDLTGDFNNRPTPLPCRFEAHTLLVPGPVCANLQGAAELQVKVAKGKTKGKTSVIAYDAPPKTTVNLFVNGAQVGTVKSDARGRIVIKRLPKGTDLREVQTIQGQDTSGNVLFTATF